MDDIAPRDIGIQPFVDALAEATPLFLLTGAGISAGSGIPTYRDAAGTWLRSDPITHQEFTQNPRQRQRYWGRSQLGWPAVRDAKPALAHRSIAALETLGALTHTVTQNVDRLHQKAGSSSVTDLHGRLDRVVCLSCDAVTERDVLQHSLEQLNPGIRGYAIEVRPDGDADLPEDLVDQVRVPPCKVCGGVLMPDVVFFGGSIPGARVTATRAALNSARAILVVGSSLQVYSGYRYCRWAHADGKPVFIINPGLTRADGMAIKCTQTADATLAMLANLLGTPVDTPSTDSQKTSSQTGISFL